MHGAGVAGFIKTCLSAQYGAMTGCLHLREINVHALENDQYNCIIEAPPYPMTSSYQGTMCQGFGGSIVHSISFAQLNYRKTREPPTPFHRMPITYWPGGGGESDWDMPSKGFF